MSGHPSVLSADTDAGMSGISMDALENADRLLADTVRRRPCVVVPATASSPMDDRMTLVIPQELIRECDDDRPVAVSVERTEPGISGRPPVASYGFLDDLALAELDRAAAATTALKQEAAACESLDSSNVMDSEMVRAASGRGPKWRWRTG